MPKPISITFPKFRRPTNRPTVTHCLTLLPVFFRGPLICVIAAFWVFALPATSSADELTIEQCSTGVDASFRGIEVVNATTAIVTGSKNTVIRTTDGGETWTRLTVADSSELDFRDIELAGDGSLLLMSAGPGEKSQIFRSEDMGDSWSRVHRNTDPMGFYDGIAIDKSGFGLLVGDPIDGRLYLLSTSDHGKSWKQQDGPDLMKGEYGFAASGTGIVLRENGHAWIATGAGAARVFRSSDGGQSWDVAATPVRSGAESEGIFSIAFNSTSHGVVVGGDYMKPEISTRNCAISADGGSRWVAVDVQMPHKACVRFLDDSKVLAVGRTGVMLSEDRGESWKTVSNDSFYTFDVDQPSGTVFMAGAAGRVGRIKVPAIR